MDSQHSSGGALWNWKLSSSSHTECVFEHGFGGVQFSISTNTECLLQVLSRMKCFACSCRSACCPMYFVFTPITCHYPLEGWGLEVCFVHCCDASSWDGAGTPQEPEQLSDWVTLPVISSILHEDPEAAVSLPAFQSQKGELRLRQQVLLKIV